MKSTIFTPVQTREPLNEIVASKIEEAICSKKYLAGDKLPSEVELCGQFGVSRTAVREALRTLSAKGLVEVIKGKGIYVLASNPDTLTDHLHRYLQLSVNRDVVLDIVKTRQVIEPVMAENAAMNHTEQDAKRLQDDINKLKTCTGPFEQLALLDMQFHLDIARASQNLIMPLLLAPIHRLMPEIKSSVYATNADARDSAVAWHQQILDAILRRDPLGAHSAMTHHLKIAEDHAEKMLRAQVEFQRIDIPDHKESRD